MDSTTRFVLVTGLSGAGKSLALRFLEDLGYYCVDNLPAPLLSTFAELIQGDPRTRRRIAVCVDVRSGDDLAQLPAHLEEAVETGVRPDVLFLDSSLRVLVQRYSESRRPHPAALDGNIEEAIRRERELLEPLRARADVRLDTSTMAVAELRERIAGMFLHEKRAEEMIITVMSFGFKYGVPQEVDLVFDVRFLPNPFYDVELRPLTGHDPEVRDYVMSNPIANEFMERTKGLLKFLIPNYRAESKSYLTIGIGCTGGQHRSVAIAQEFTIFLRDLGCNARARHRDVNRSRTARPAQ
jgi:UPF0042 nucleotide-binding protein